MRSLKRPQTRATRTPSPCTMPLYRFAARDGRSKDVIESLQEVAHALALGPQVGDVLGVRLGLQRHALDDLEAEALEATVLGRVVGHVAQRGDAEVDEDLGADAVLPVVDGEAELDVGVD